MTCAEIEQAALASDLPRAHPLPPSVEEAEAAQGKLHHTRLHPAGQHLGQP